MREERLSACRVLLEVLQMTICWRTSRGNEGHQMICWEPEASLNPAGICFERLAEYEYGPLKFQLIFHIGDTHLIAAQIRI